MHSHTWTGGFQSGGKAEVKYQMKTEIIMADSKARALKSESQKRNQVINIKTDNRQIPRKHEKGWEDASRQLANICFYFFLLQSTELDFPTRA